MELKPLTSTLRFAWSGLLLGALGVCGIGIALVLIIFGLGEPADDLEEILFNGILFFVPACTLGASVLGIRSVVCELINRHVNEEMRTHPYWVGNEEDEAGLFSHYLTPVLAVLALNLLCIVPCVFAIVRFFG